MKAADEKPIDIIAIGTKPKESRALMKVLSQHVLGLGLALTMNCVSAEPNGDVHRFQQGELIGFRVSDASKVRGVGSLTHTKNTVNRSAMMANLQDDKLIEVVYRQDGRPKSIVIEADTFLRASRHMQATDTIVGIAPGRSPYEVNLLLSTEWAAVSDFVLRMDPDSVTPGFADIFTEAEQKNKAKPIEPINWFGALYQFFDPVIPDKLVDKEALKNKNTGSP